MRDIIIAIDGNSSCGKSTLAKSLAVKLQYRYVDTGAMYRAVALHCMRKKLLGAGFDPSDVIAELPIDVDFEFDAGLNRNVTTLNGENVEDEIRGVAVSREVSKVSQITEVRKFLIDRQRKMGENRRIVMDGRDIGTKVFPGAELKLFITAELEERVSRRYKQMTDNGVKVTLEEVRENLKQRDYDDEHKGDQPLKKAADAIEIDNTHLTVAEQFDMAYKLAIEKINQ